MNMAPALRLDDEAGRLAALRRYEILDTEPEKEFSDIVTLLKSIFNVTAASVNLIDADRQWSKASAGAPDVHCRRQDAFCDYTIRGAGSLLVEDASVDSRFLNNPFVTGAAHIRAYLGVPLTTPDGYNIGALCVFDTEPHKFTAADQEVLHNLAKVVISQLELRLVSRQDGLTGALTRSAFLDKMERVAAAAAAAASAEDDSLDRGPTTLLMLDLDHFKVVNDTFGHPVGDLALRHLAQTIKAHLRRTDDLGRLGGEEFGVLLSKVGAEMALELAERLRQALAAAPLAELSGHPLTLSIGIAELVPGEMRDTWLARADQALYAAKHAGRNRCILADALTALDDAGSATA